MTAAITGSNYARDVAARVIAVATALLLAAPPWSATQAAPPKQSLVGQSTVTRGGGAPDFPRRISPTSSSAQETFSHEDDPILNEIPCSPGTIRRADGPASDCGLRRRPGRRGLSARAQLVSRGLHLHVGCRPVRGGRAAETFGTSKKPPRRAVDSEFMLQRLLVRGRASSR